MVDIFEASKKGQTDLIRQFIAEGGDLNQRDHKGYTSLYYTLNAKNLKGLACLLEAGAEITGDLNQMFLLLIHASGYSFIPTFIDAGADVNSREPITGDTALMLAADTGDVETLTALIIAGADVHCRNLEGQNALMLAAKNGKTAAVLILLGAGADINAMALDSNTALRFAAMAGHVDTVQMLLARGATFDKSRPEGASALTHAAANGHYKVAKALLVAGADPNRFILAKPDISRKSYTPLAAAANAKHISIIELLLQYKADVNVCSDLGEAPLHCALHHDTFDVLNILLAHGADICAKNRFGQSSITLAAYKADLNLLKVLVNSRPYDDRMHQEIKRALEIAKEQGCTDIVQAIEQNELVYQGPVIVSKPVAPYRRSFSAPIDCRTLAEVIPSSKDSLVIAAKLT